MNLHTMYKAGMIAAPSSNSEEEDEEEEDDDEIVERGFPNEQQKKKKKKKKKKKRMVAANNSGNTKSTTGTTASNNTYTATIQTTAATVAAAASMEEEDNDNQPRPQQQQPQTPNRPSEPPGRPPMSPAIQVIRQKKTTRREATQADYDEDGLNEQERAEEERRRRRKKTPLLESPFEELVIDHGQQADDDDVSFITMPKSIRDDQDVTGKRIATKQTIGGLQQHIQKRSNSRQPPSISNSADTDHMANLLKLKQRTNVMVQLSSDGDDDNEEVENSKEAENNAQEKQQKVPPSSPSAGAPLLGNPTQKSLLDDNDEDHVDPQWEAAVNRGATKEAHEEGFFFRTSPDDEEEEEEVGVHPQDKPSTSISPSAAAPPQRVTSVEEDAIRDVTQQMKNEHVLQDIHVVLPMHSDEEDDQEDMSSVSQSHPHQRTLDAPLMPPFAPEQDQEEHEEHPAASPMDPPSSFDKDQQQQQQTIASTVAEEPSQSNVEEEPTESHRDEDDTRPQTSNKKRKKKKKKSQEDDCPKKKKKKKKKEVDGDADPSSPKKKKKKKKKKSATSARSVDKEEKTISNDDSPRSIPKPSNKPVSESTATTSEDLTSRTASSNRLMTPFSWKGRNRRNNPPHHISMAGYLSNDRILEENHSMSDDDAIVNAMAQSSLGASSADGSRGHQPTRKRIFRFGKKKNDAGIDTSTGSGAMMVQKSDHRPKQRKWYAPMKLKPSQLSFKRKKNKPAEDAFQELTTAATGTATGVRSMSTMENVAACASSRGDSSGKAEIDFHHDADDASSMSAAKSSAASSRRRWRK